MFVSAVVAAVLAWFFLSRMIWSGAGVNREDRAELVGSAVCAKRHATEPAAWRKSQHAAAMQEAKDRLFKRLGGHKVLAISPFASRKAEASTTRRRRLDGNVNGPTATSTTTAARQLLRHGHGGHPPLLNGKRQRHNVTKKQPQRTARNNDS